MSTLGYEPVARGDAPILVVTPHTGSEIPADLLDHAAWQPIKGRLADPAGLLLQSVALEYGATVISGHYHPCVIDFNVAEDNRSLTPSLNRLGLCRTHTSRGEALYEKNAELSADEVAARVEKYWRPFHRCVANEIGRLRAMHEQVVVLVSHASWWLSPYRSQHGSVDFNIGTCTGLSSDRTLVKALTDAVQARGWSWVVNGKIADNFAAQHYGNPRAGVHVIEMEAAGRFRLECAARFDPMQADPGQEQDGLETTIAATLKALGSAVHTMTPGESAPDSQRSGAPFH